MRESLSASIQKIFQNLLIATGVLCCLLLFILVRPPKEENTERKVVEFWNVVGAQEVDPPAPGWFNASQDEIYVKRVGVPFLEIERKFLTGVIGNCSPDLFEYFGPVAQWSSRGALLPLDDYMERDGFDRTKIFPALWEEMMWEGQTFAIPTGSACDAFYWNKEHFRKAGLDPKRPPKTWEELVEYAEKLTIRDDQGEIIRAGYIPGYWDPFGTNLFAHWPLQKGAVFLTDDGHKVNLTSQACIEALEWETGIFEKLGRNDLIKMRSSFGYGAQHGFSSGQLSMVIQKSSFIQELAKFAPDLEYGISMFPVPEDGHSATLFGSVWIGIPVGAENPDAAWEFIKFYTQTETQKNVGEFLIDNSLVGFFPANIKAAKSPKQLAMPGMPVFIESMKWSHSPTIVPLAHNIFWREYGNAWDEATRGLNTPENALRKAEQIIQRALDDQIEYNDFYVQYLEEKNQL